MLRSNLVHTAEPHKGLKQGHRLSSQKVGVCVGAPKGRIGSKSVYRAVGPQGQLSDLVKASTL